MIEDFLKQTRKLLEQTQVHLAKKEFSKAAELMHTIKGTSATLGFEKLTNSAAKLEMGFNSGKNGAKTMHEFESIFGNISKDLSAK